ncbi:MAG: hypothetical protein IJ824_00780 [Alphaproteobacteria bacterium]|nr:hypothetical protein [Alphaproteobacteria bacterium]
MRDNSCATTCRAGMEKGIVLNKDYYLDIHSLMKYPLSRHDAKLYSKQVNLPLPTKKQLQLLADNIEMVTESLLRAGLGDYLFIGNLVQECWTRRASEQNSETERRRVVFIVPV